VRQPNGDVEVTMYSPEECHRDAEGQGRGRSTSPTKRSRKEASDIQADEHEAAHFSRKRSWSSTGSVDLDQEPRGRKRRRSSSIPTLS
jgi:hypothetical protein